MIGSSIGPYQIVRKLGAGGMGEVYLGLDSRLHRHVALKGLLDPDAQRSDVRSRVMREARAAARLHHENIAGIYDVIEHDGRPFIVMEYIEGESLSRRLERGPFSHAEIRRVGRQLASALAAAHEQGVVHRDLKPANVHVTPDGSIRVLDFGVAKLSSTPAAGPEHETNTAAIEPTLGGNPGTVVYMSPEQLLNRDVDGRSDIYSAGVILFLMATGRRPFEERDSVSLAVAISTQSAPAAHAINAELPPDLSDTIARALERNPDDRFQTARELEAALAGATDTATPGPIVRTRGRFRRPLTALLIAAAVLVAVAALSWRQLPDILAPAGPPPAIVLAMLPVETPAGDTQAEYVGAGMASAIAGNFGSLSRITVLARGATMPYVKSGNDFTELQRALGATHVLGLSLQTAGNRSRLAATLYRPGAAAPVWTDALDGDVLGIERGLLADLGRAFERGTPRRRFTSDEWARLRKLPTSSAEALMALAEARALLDRPAQDVDRSIALLERATMLDPQFAIAWATLGDAWWNKYQRDRDLSHATTATQAVERALAIDPDSAPVHYALGNMQFRTGRTAEAEASFRRALQLQPDFDLAQRALAQSVAGTGRVDEAEALLAQAIRVNPTWNNYFMLGTIDYRAGRYPAAADGFRHAIEANPNNAGAFTMLGNTQFILGDLQQAAGNFEHAVRLGPTAAAHANLGLVYYAAGRFDDAVRAYQEALQRDPKSATNHRNIGDVYGRLGRASDARAAYQRAIALGNDMLAVNARDVATIGLIALCEAKLGRRLEAERHAAEAVAVDATSREAWQRSAEVHALLKQPDAALRDLAIAVARGFDPKMARTDDELAPLRKIPRFEEILSGQPGNALTTQGAKR